MTTSAHTKLTCVAAAAQVLIMTLVYTGVCMLLPHFFKCRSTDCTVPVTNPTAEPTCPSALVHSNDTLITTNEDLALVRFLAFSSLCSLFFFCMEPLA